MRLLALSLAFISFFPAPAQDKPERQRQACVVVAKEYLKCQSTDMKESDHIEYARTAQVGDHWWPVGDGRITVTLEAVSIKTSDSKVIRLSGNVEIHNTKLALLADEAVYHAEFGEIEATGNVRIIPVR
jgi:lipopolysaccharide assembly outer membrane protein LptD (OstA)